MEKKVKVFINGVDCEKYAQFQQVSFIREYISYCIGGFVEFIFYKDKQGYYFVSVSANFTDTHFDTKPNDTLFGAFSDAVTMALNLYDIPTNNENNLLNKVDFIRKILQDF